jgi:hypothetical protein
MYAGYLCVPITGIRNQDQHVRSESVYLLHWTRYLTELYGPKYLYLYQRDRRALNYNTGSINALH